MEEFRQIQANISTANQFTMPLSMVGLEE